MLETTWTCALVAVGATHPVKDAQPLHVPVRPLVLTAAHVSGAGGDLKLVPVGQANLAIHPRSEHVTHSNPSLPSNQSLRASLLGRFRLARRYVSFSVRCPAVRSILRGRNRLPDSVTKSLSGFTPSDPPGRAFCFADTPRTLSVREPPAGGALDSSCGPLPRRPVKSAVFPARRTFHRRVLFPQRRLSTNTASCKLALTRGAGALPEMAISCASHRLCHRLLSRFVVRVIPHLRDGRSRSPFTQVGNRSFLRALLWIETVTGFRAALLHRAGWALRLL